MAPLTPKTGAELKEFTTSLLDGDVMDDTPFYIMLNMVKTIVESIRPWRKLLTIDTSQTFGPGDTYTTIKSLPAGFIMFDQYDPMVLIAGDQVVKPEGITIAEREIKKNEGPYFYTDLKNDGFGIIHNPSTTFTVQLAFIEESDEITDSTSWAFPARFHPLLAYMVSGMQKGGVDYDDIFARMAPENRAQAQVLVDAMEMWDDALQRQAYGY